ncbi:hypothetical protein BGZ63DRAFT_421654 [Mariannaea sp. PMI_226]|nr:hypothetical protein BGZ63DRAFT_421654 [Mariannaea sp. PMI_226]
MTFFVFCIGAPLLRIATQLSGTKAQSNGHSSETWLPHRLTSSNGADGNLSPGRAKYSILNTANNLSSHGIYEIGHSRRPLICPHFT